MPEPQASQSIGSLQVELSSELYDALMAKVRSSGCSTNELVQQGLRLYLGLETNDRTKERTEDSRSTVEQTIESRLSELESRIMERVCLEIEARMASIKVATNSSNSPNISLAETSAEKTMPPTVRQLQIGDIVQIRDPDSPHYKEHVRVSEVGIIRATVITDLGNQTFLKRDLRFVRSETDAIA